MTETKSLPVLRAGQMQQTAEYHRSVRLLVVDNDTTLDDLLRPGFWAHYATTLKRYDIVEVIRQDFSLEVDLRVMGTDIGMAHVRVRSITKLPTAEDEAMRTRQEKTAAKADMNLPELPPGYRVGFTPRHQHYAIWDETKEMVVKGQPNKLAAVQGAIEHAKKAGNPLAAAA